MNCPHCNHEQTCPCKSCQKRNPTEFPWIWTEDGNNIACGCCGIIKHCDEWLDISMTNYRNKE